MARKTATEKAAINENLAGDVAAIAADAAQFEPPKEIDDELRQNALRYLAVRSMPEVRLRVLGSHGDLAERAFDRKVDSWIERHGLHL